MGCMHWPPCVWHHGACQQVMQHGWDISGMHIHICQQVAQPLLLQEGVSMLLPCELLLDILLVWPTNHTSSWSYGGPAHPIKLFPLSRVLIDKVRSTVDSHFNHVNMVAHSMKLVDVEIERLWEWDWSCFSLSMARGMLSYFPPLSLHSLLG